MKIIVSMRTHSFKNLLLIQEEFGLEFSLLAVR